MKSEALSHLETRGWVIATDAVPSSHIRTLASELEVALVRRENIRRANQVGGQNDGTLHHLLADHRVFVDLLKQLSQFEGLVRDFLSGNFILNSYGGVINEVTTRAYVHNVHRDIRFASDTKRFMLNCLVMLDDFTVDNGATYLLSGSQTVAERPSDELFFQQAERALGPMGSVLFFDSRMWHATGANRTASARRALTLTFTSPFFKQQLDYPRLLGYDAIEALSPFLRQIIGFNARVPATLEEFYVPVEKRFYQRGQDE
jgi:hypothetical protein